MCEPRQLCTAATCLGFLMSLISKMRTPRKRSGLGGMRTASATPGSASAPAASGRWARAADGSGGCGDGDALRAAIDAPVHGFGRHEEQVAVDGDVALSAGADQRSAELDLAGLSMS